jgi:hypothetical protein
MKASNPAITLHLDEMAKKVIWQADTAKLEEHTSMELKKKTGSNLAASLHQDKIAQKWNDSSLFCKQAYDSWKSTKQWIQRSRV